MSCPRDLLVIGQPIEGMEDEEGLNVKNLETAVPDVNEESDTIRVKHEIVDGRLPALTHSGVPRKEWSII